MLLPDNINPENSIYYLAYLIIKEVKDIKRVEELYSRARKKYNISYNNFCYCMDWLYIANVIEVKDDGELKKCF